MAASNPPDGWVSVDVSDEEVEEAVKKASSTVKVKLEKPVPPPEPPLPTVAEPILPYPDTDKILHHQYAAAAFTIEPVDVSDNNVSDKYKYLGRKVVSTKHIRKDSLVIVCAKCGKIIPNELCEKCYPYGVCITCHAPLQEDGVCWTCNPFGVCPICGTKRKVADLCWSDYCQNQQMVIRCDSCGKPVSGDGQCMNAACPKFASHPFDCTLASCRQFCVSKVSGEDEGTEAAQNTRKAACKLWHVNPELSVYKEAINFYTVWGLYRYYEDENAKKILDEQVERLSREFADYLELAVGGELRHTMVYNSAYKDIIPIWLQNQFPCRKARPCAWLRWKGVREENGIQAIRDAVMCFKLPKWPRSYGGNNWATIAQTLLDYREGTLSPISFVDLSFSLEHNCGCAFNKVYDVSGLQEVLNVCQDKKDPTELAASSYGKYISSEIKVIVKKHGKT